MSRLSTYERNCMSLKDKIVLVSGASRGIGKAIALKFGGLGARVAVNYNANAEAAQQVAEQIVQAGGDAFIIKADVASRSDCTRMVDQIIERWQTVHVLINNAGVTRDGLLMSMDDTDWDTVINTNLGGTAFLTKTVLPYMMMQKYGRVINISSVSADKGRKGQTSYSASKGAVNSLTKVLASEVASKGVTVNAIEPGMIETDMSGAVRGLASKQILAQIPVGRFGTPDDIADTAVFLASNQASYITGAIIRVDGGLSLGIGV